MKFIVTIQQKINIEAADEETAIKLAEFPHYAPYRNVVSGDFIIKTLPKSVRVISIEEVKK